MSRLLAVLLALAAPSAAAAQFTYQPAGDLVAGSGGPGVTTGIVYSPTMRFPIGDLPAYANSQVWGYGGMHSPGAGSQCDARNYSFPWRDNYCETRGWAMPLCPSAHGHQGQDIRPGTCQGGVHPGVAAVAGRITSVGTYSVYLTAPDGTRYDYLHMRPVSVTTGTNVACGAQLGMVNNYFGTTPTTIHLHFNMQQSVRGIGRIYVQPYMSLVQAYQRAASGTEMCAPPADAGVDAGRDAGPPPPRPCHSTTLGRNVVDGECVQVGPDRRECGAGCGWYVCRSGAWMCTDPSACTAGQNPNAGCGPTGARCRSATLGRDVEHGECVQVAYAGCGASSCAWYQCANGAWQCSDSGACNATRYPSAYCSRDSGPGCATQSGAACASDADCCSTAGAMMRCIANSCRSATECNLQGTSCTSSLGCCQGLSCLARTFGGARECCVATAGAYCAVPSDCCGTTTCLNNRCTSRGAGEPCATSYDCTTGLTCQSGTCG